MKNKRTAKSYNRYNGYNVYGEPCEVRTIKLKNETALEQCLEAISKVEIAQAEGRRLEYTFDWTGMDREVVDRVSKKLDDYARIRRMYTASFHMS